MERALAEKRASLDPRDARVIDSTTSLAILHSTAGNNGRADELFEDAMRALDIDAVTAQSVIPENESARYLLSSLGSVLRKRGAVREAVVVLERALALGEKISGPNSKEVAKTLNNLALAVEERGDPARATKLLERALAIDEKVHGKDSAEVAIVLQNLAAGSSRAGDLAKAKKSFARSAAILSSTSGRTASSWIARTPERRPIRCSDRRSCSRVQTFARAAAKTDC